MPTNATIDPEVTSAEPQHPLILSGAGYGLEISESARKQKDTLLRESKLIVTITDATADAAADHQLRKLSAMRIAAEKSRVEVKKPALEFGKEVDATAKEFVGDIEAEERRLKAARGEYAAAVLAERKRVLAEMEAKRRAEEEAERKAEEARRKAEEAEAEARRKAEEAAFNASTPEEDAAAAKAAEEAAALEAKRKAEEAAAKAKEEAAQPAVPAFVPEAPKGVKMVPDYEVTDLDALYRHDPGLVTMEPRRKDILDAIARGMTGDNPPQIPGLRVFMKPHVTAR